MSPASAKRRTSGPARKLAASDRHSRARRDFGIFSGLVLAAAIFAQVRAFEFVAFDDLSSERGLGPLTRNNITLEGLWWALISGADNWWFPGARFSRALDCGLFGLNNRPHHLTSVLLLWTCLHYSERPGLGRFAAVAVLLPLSLMRFAVKAMLSAGGTTATAIGRTGAELELVGA